ncbi:hypothetical protein [Paractinoplanes brasiliensis]|uniref:Streptogrisin C n=1 Tax=Paractinoplanes brasiliensis TaxID=52695 RepID=A0A4R6JLC8_9ACTN|nr:hypothetical protein [Actinoplanes brasiliensis]TDO36929.1 streptogrisin C [Actinoplanes brasiliensis]GID30451.1 hypothetical protein Abr02nite_54340 [Actinoplanes brasiliensis]
MERTSVIAVVTATVLAAGSLTVAGPAAADVSLDLPRQAAPVAQENRGSIAYLTARYKISEDEALRRLALQKLAPALDAELAKKFPKTFAGSYLDQAGGGRLVVNSTDPAGMTAALAAAGDSAHVVAAKVKWSLAELTATEARLRRTVGDPHETTARKAEFAIDVPGNTVAVYQRAGMTAPSSARLSAAAADAAQARPAVADATLTAAVVAEAGRAEVRQLVAGAEKTGPVTMDAPVGPGCDTRQCGPPMRGGMRLNVRRSQAAPTGSSTGYLNPWYGQCTNGFNVSDNRGWNYIMTAGHCMVGSYKVGINRTYSAGTYTPVSYEVHNYENGCNGSDCGPTYPYDYSIQPYQVNDGYNWYDYWSGPYAKNQVVSWCWWTSSTWQGCVDGTFAIRGFYTYNSIAVGWVVCGTGSGDAGSDSGYTRNVNYVPGTRCGEVTGKDGGIRTNICTRPGDSGGPLFSEIDGMAYGILSTGHAGTGACPASPAGTEWSSYTPVSNIHSHVTTQLANTGEPALGFRIRTTP